MKILERFFPLTTRATIATRWLGFTKIPLLYFARPSVMELTDEKIVVKIPLRRRTKNHLGSMYFGALAVGADVSAGLIAWRRIDESGVPISLVFKDISGEFLRRPEADVHFTCTEGGEIDKLVQNAATSGEREEMPIHVMATVPSLTGDEPVARFTLTLSIKKK
jgi:acyl-coenzyme A thioesterase PaaI-like protein